MQLSNQMNQPQSFVSSEERKCFLLDCPKDSLLDISLYLTHRERITLGATCRLLKSILYDESYWEMECKRLFGVKKITRKFAPWRKYFFHKARDSCFYHIEKKGRTHLILDVRLCYECQKKDQYSAITKTNAIKEYLLKEEDLFENARFETKKNPHHKSTSMTLFLLEDVKKLAILKWSSWEQLEQAKAKRRKRKKPAQDE